MRNLCDRYTKASTLLVLIQKLLSGNHKDFSLSALLQVRNDNSPKNRTCINKGKIKCTKKMLDDINIYRVLFIDIETVPIVSDFSELTEEMQKLWKYRTEKFQPNDINDVDYFFQKAGVYAEFGKIICISVGFFRRSKEEDTLPSFRVKSFYGDDEKAIMEPFLELLKRYFSIPTPSWLCGHNIRSFDVPFLGRRTIINHLSLPKVLDVHALKPWEVPYLDTMLMWKFGDYRNYTSLHLLCNILGIENPKKELEGSQVATVYYNEKNGLEKIKEYCQQDVIAVAQLLLRFKGMDSLNPEQLVFVTNEEE